MNEELLAASAFLVQKWRLIGQFSYQVGVSFVNCSVWLAIRRLILTPNVKPTQVCSAPSGRKVITKTLAAPQRKL
jgi:hypothetical protein